MAAPFDRVDGDGDSRGTPMVDYSRIVHVHIQGQPYAIKSDLDPAYVLELATFVDDRIQKASTQIASTDALRTAVVAALNIADEFFRARADGSGVEHDVLARAATLERFVDRALSGLSTTTERDKSSLSA